MTAELNFMLNIIHNSFMYKTILIRNEESKYYLDEECMWLCCSKKLFLEHKIKWSKWVIQNTKYFLYNFFAAWNKMRKMCDGVVQNVSILENNMEIIKSVT